METCFKPWCGVEKKCIDCIQQVTTKQKNKDKIMPNKTFTTSNKLVKFLDILQKEHFTQNQLNEMIERAEQTSQKTPANIEPHTLGFHANHLAQRLQNRK